MKRRKGKNADGDRDLGPERRAEAFRAHARETLCACYSDVAGGMRGCSGGALFVAGWLAALKLVSEMAARDPLAAAIFMPEAFEAYSGAAGDIDLDQAKITTHGHTEEGPVPDSKMDKSPRV